jgi:hypothetical protein
MTWTDPATRQTGDLITAAIWNQDVVDNLEYLHANLPERATLWHDESQVEAGNSLTQALDASQRYGTRVHQNPPADNDAFTQSFVLKAGTYTFHVLGITQSNCGKIDWTIDGTAIASGQDWYSSSTTYNVVKSVTGVVISGNGRHVLKGRVNGRNASATDYHIRLTKMWLEPADDTQGV